MSFRGQVRSSHPCMRVFSSPVQSVTPCTRCNFGDKSHPCARVFFSSLVQSVALCTRVDFRLVQSVTPRTRVISGAITIVTPVYMCIFQVGAIGYTVYTCSFQAGAISCILYTCVFSRKVQSNRPCTRVLSEASTISYTLYSTHSLGTRAVTRVPVRLLHSRP